MRQRLASSYTATTSTAPSDFNPVRKRACGTCRTSKLPAARITSRRLDRKPEARAAASSTSMILVRVSISESLISRLRLEDRFDQSACLLLYSGCFHARHAAMVNGALAQKAGAAIDRRPHDASQERRRAGRLGIGCAEYSDGRDAHRRSDMHGAAVIGHKRQAGRGKVDEFRQTGAPGEIPRLRSDLLSDSLAQLELRGCSKYGHTGPPLGGEPSRNGGKPFWKPPFRRAKSRARTYAQDSFRAQPETRT